MTEYEIGYAGEFFFADGAQARNVVNNVLPAVLFTEENAGSALGNGFSVTEVVAADYGKAVLGKVFGKGRIATDIFGNAVRNL